MGNNTSPFFSFSRQYSLCNEPLIELSNPGASGSLFYVTSDDEFIIKTVMHKEAEFLQKLLPGYYMVCVSSDPARLCHSSFSVQSISQGLFTTWVSCGLSPCQGQW